MKFKRPPKPPKHQRHPALIQRLKTRLKTVPASTSRIIDGGAVTAQRLSRAIAQKIRAIPNPIRAIKLGRIFRRMGLPPWTFAGIGITAIWFNYLGLLVEKFLSVMLGASGAPTGIKDVLPALIVFLIPFVVVVAVGCYHNASRHISKKFSSDGTLHQPDGKKGLILLVSNPASAKYAIAYHLGKGTLEQIWLIPSDGTATEQFGSDTLAQAQTIKQECQNLTTPDGQTIAIKIIAKGVSPADSQDTFDIVNRIFRESGYEPGSVIADFTGGTKPMAVGMIMACLPADRELEYVSYNGNTQTSFGPFLIDYQHRAFDLVG